jgi:N-acetylated-alpha-linked acidic dipeptidase
MTAPYTRSLATKEHGFPWQEEFEDVVVGYNAYSPSGDVSGQLVYANYGLPQDYAALEGLGVDVRGKIVLVRYGGSFRGVKAQQAEKRGARA